MFDSNQTTHSSTHTRAQGNTKDRYRTSRWTVESAVAEIEFQDHQLVERGLRLIQLERDVSRLIRQYDELAKKHCIK